MDQLTLDKLETFLKLDYMITINVNNRKKIVSKINDDTIFFTDGLTIDGDSVDLTNVSVVDSFTGFVYVDWQNAF